MKTKLPTEWLELTEQLGFQEFTPIQTQLFDPILDGQTHLMQFLNCFLTYTVEFSDIHLLEETFSFIRKNDCQTTWFDSHSS